jgi:hypothetical protein
MNRVFWILITSVILAVCVIPAAKAHISVLSTQTTDDFGSPIPGVTIRIGYVISTYQSEQFGTEIIVTTSDDSGFTPFYFMEPGHYWIRAEKAGFYPVDISEILIEENALVFCKLQFRPCLASLAPDRRSRVVITYRNFPFIFPGRMLLSVRPESTSIPEIMETLPGITLQPETGLPRFASQRTSDAGLYIDGIPLQDPSDQRPAFFPPLTFIDSVTAVKAGQDVDQQSAAGGAIYLRSRQPEERILSGMIGWSDIIFNDSFILDRSSRDMFEYWNAKNDLDVDIPEREPELSDRRCNLLLSSSFDNLYVTGAADWRYSNRGYASDYVNEDSLEDVNAWVKSTYSWNNRKRVIMLLAGYQTDSIQTEHQWTLRGMPPLISENKKLFIALHLKQHLFSSYWVSIAASSLMLDSQAESTNDTEQHPGSYPYNLGAWFADKNRSVQRLILKGGNVSIHHAIEAGIALSLIYTDVNEGFHEVPGSTFETINYEWLADSSDYELSMWGRDRWFLSEHLELGFAIRWDRFNYLEQSDYLSPRIYAAWNWGKNRLTGGVERIIQSPGIGFLAEQVRFSDQMDSIEPVTEPQSGFRWYGGYRRTYDTNKYIDVNGYYSFLSTMVFMLPVETDPGIEFNLPAQGEAGKSMGIFFNTVWEMPDEQTVFNLAYGFHRSRVSWGDDITLTHIRPYAEMPWRKLYYTGSFDTPVPMDNDLTHAIRLSGQTKIPLLDVAVGVDYHYTTGFAYTRVEDYNQTSSTIPNETINAQKGSAVQRLDIDAAKVFNLSAKTALKVQISVKNAFNRYQFPAIDPTNGKSVVDPYRMTINQPRSVHIGCYLYF